MNNVIEVEKGYKKTSMGILPSDWEVVHVEDVALVDKESLNGNTDPDYTFEYISLSDVDEKVYSTNTVQFKNAPSRARRLVFGGDIIMSTVRPNLQGFAMIKEDKRPLVASTGFAVITANKIEKSFLFQLLFSEVFSKQFYQLTVGSNYPAINSSDVKRLKVPFPPVIEQNKIGNVLETWDNGIEILTKSLEQLRLRKKGLMQQIFSGELRLQNPSGKSFQDWKAQKLGHYLKVSKAKNLDLKYGGEDVLSVSGEFGIVNQIEFHGRSFAGASVANYGVVETGDIVYTKSPLKANPYGIIKVNKGVPGIVSTLYAIYKCKPTVNGEFVDYYFQLDDNVNRYLRPLVQKGTKNDMKINNEKVLIDKVLFPSVEEQAVIVDFFKTVDQEITETKNYLETLKTQKKGLMQKLLTGEVRVKI